MKAMDDHKNAGEKPEKNRELSIIFKEMARCYRYLGPEERFRAQAYEKAAGVLNNMKETIETRAGNLSALEAISGIGESIALKIGEYLRTGRIRQFEELKKRVPFELLELMDVNGIGPATLKKLHDQLGIKDQAGLIRALEQKKLNRVNGFGEKKIQNLQRSLKLTGPKKRLPLKQASRIGENWLKQLKDIPGVQNAVLAGSLRRKKNTIGDIDVVIVAHEKDRKRIVARMIRLPGISKIIVKGLTRVSLELEKENMQTDIRLVRSDQFGSALLYFTGSREHVIWLRTLAKKKNWKINEYGLFDTRSGKRLAGDTEESIYHCLGMKWVAPEER